MTRKSHSLKNTQAWKNMSKYVRLLEKGVCFTCGNYHPIDECQAGHFKHSDTSTFFEEMNVHCQCIKCNQYLSGNLSVYALRMIDKYGLEAVRDLDKRSNEYKKRPSKLELKQISLYYKNKLKNL